MQEFRILKETAGSRDASAAQRILYDNSPGGTLSACGTLVQRMRFAASPPFATADGTAMMATKPEDCDREFAACVKARDLDGLAGLYEPDAKYIRRDGTIVIGQDAIRALLQSLTNVATEIEMNLVRVVALNAIAVIYNDWRSKSVSEDGKVRESSGRAIEVVRRQPDGRWLFAIDDPFGRSRSG